MKIIALEIIGLNGSEQPINLTFNDDLNIITGRNGAGKTTILKIIWYLISGNFKLLSDEINFQQVVIHTSGYTFMFPNEKQEKDTVIDFYNSLKYENLGDALFFPTFRRIEHNFFSKKNEDFERDLKVISSDLSTPFHKFIFTIGTKDIENLIFKHYSEISEKINKQQEDLNNQIVEKIANANSDINILTDIKQQIEELEEYRKEKMQPFTSLKQLLKKFFQGKNINISDIDTLSIGDMATAISSDLLSAGEKQMLSFLAYNAVYNDTIFIIDEPELSLHGDWQRLLIPTLLKQNPSNQFIMATHSPFIYSKYPDKELRLVADRGNAEKQNAKQDIIIRGKHG